MRLKSFFSISFEADDSSILLDILEGVEGSRDLLHVLLTTASSDWSPNRTRATPRTFRLRSAFHPLKQNGLYTFVRWNTIMTNPPLRITTEDELAEGFKIIDALSLRPIAPSRK